MAIQLRCTNRCNNAPNAVLLATMLLMSVASMRARAQSWDLGALRGLAGLTADQWKAVNRGEAQARVLDTKGKHEVAVVGVTRLRATTACFVTRFQDIENFKKSSSVLRIGKFAKPVTLQDLERFRLEFRDIAALRNCRVGSCDVKLSAGVIERLGRDVDWSAPDHVPKAQTVLREEFLSYIETYLSDGNASLIEYRDKNKPVLLADEFQALLNARPGLAGFVPEFREYLAQYPNKPLPGVDEFLYWSTESFGLKPVTSITHVAIYHEQGQAVIASKQVYGSHYFEGSLGLTVALDDIAEQSKPGMYLLYLNRSRIDLLSGFFGGLRRAFLRGRLRDGIKKNLVEVARKLESSCAQYPLAAPTSVL